MSIEFNPSIRLVQHNAPRVFSEGARRTAMKVAGLVATAMFVAVSFLLFSPEVATIISAGAAVLFSFFCCRERTARSAHGVFFDAGPNLGEAQHTLHQQSGQPVHPVANAGARVQIAGGHAQQGESSLPSQRASSQSGRGQVRPPNRDGVRPTLHQQSGQPVHPVANAGSRVQIAGGHAQQGESSLPSQPASSQPVDPQPRPPCGDPRRRNNSRR